MCVCVLRDLSRPALASHVRPCGCRPSDHRLRASDDGESDYGVFDDVPAAHLTKDMLELARHVVKTKSGHFEPKKFEDVYEDALRALLAKKQKGEKIMPPKEHAPAKVVMFCGYSGCVRG
jgi:non-homologous end joining protein Ku